MKTGTFVLEPDDFDAFMRVLDNPPAPSERLKRLMQSATPWEADDGFNVGDGGTEI